MNASKETCRKAKDNLWAASYMLDDLPKEKSNPIKRLMIQVLAFLDAAERKLPTEAAYDRDSKRRKAKAGK